ncbi:hypothetical protein P8452_26020 [Trifolium repens]|nr:hypothetical protein P8452_26020 [Trifolium repens]
MEVLKFKHLLQQKIPFNLSLSLLPLYTQIFGFYFSLSFDINPAGENDEADNTDEAKRLLLMGLRKMVYDLTVKVHKFESAFSDLPFFFSFYKTKNENYNCIMLL